MPYSGLIAKSRLRFAVFGPVAQPLGRLPPVSDVRTGPSRLRRDRFQGLVPYRPSPPRAIGVSMFTSWVLTLRERYAPARTAPARTGAVQGRDVRLGTSADGVCPVSGDQRHRARPAVALLHDRPSGVRPPGPAGACTAVNPTDPARTAATRPLPKLMRTSPFVWIFITDCR